MVRTANKLLAASAEQALHQLGSPEIATVSLRFFKTGEGEYGEGDRFIGVRVPVVRKLARSYRQLPSEETVLLLRSPIHEARLLALVILVQQFERGAERERQAIYRLYRAEREYVNNWDLVDISAPSIMGGYLFDRSRKPLYLLARARGLWDRRIAIVATQYFIRQGDVTETWEIARLLLDDSEDLIHKATGWTLREAGKRNPSGLRKFLDRHASNMPRTMLRYALERCSPSVRKIYMQKI